MSIVFLGAGPGDPELITVKGKKAIEAADIIIYAGSLVNPAVLEYNTKGATIYNSASMTLEEVMEVMIAGTKAGKAVARVHTGDPSIYGAIQEQIDVLRQEGLEFDIIPGVSSFVAVAAALEQEYTLPDVTQTVILTRIEGRTPVPAGESLASLASHRATMCIFLSVHKIEEVVEQLLAGYKDNTPVAVVQKASWPEQKIIRGTLTNIAELVKAEAIGKTAMIVVSEVFLGDYSLSKLYDKSFTHEFRQAKL